MPRDIPRRLAGLQQRRHGTDRLNRLAEDAQRAVLLKSAAAEVWEKRAKSQPYTRYALGAMQAVDADHTGISLETAGRVGGQLNTRLAASGLSVEFRLQGSVPLDVHIRGVSDVDLLSIDTSFLTYNKYGPLADSGRYCGTDRTSVDVLTALRRTAERALRDSFPAAEVDSTGSKAIMISGGSLARPVDVVPAHWFDTVTYQTSGQEHDRAVTILNTKTQATVDNWPFLHIKRIHERDSQVFGGLKKAIRLCKNVKSDAEDDGTAMDLPSFDIAAVMYHANMQTLSFGVLFELTILAETQRYLDFLATHEAEAVKLLVPDESRRIFDSRAKLEGLRLLSIEMDDLLREVAKEQDYLLAQIDRPSLSSSRDVVSRAQP